MLNLKDMNGLEGVEFLRTYEWNVQEACRYIVKEWLPACTEEDLPAMEEMRQFLNERALECAQTALELAPNDRERRKCIAAVNSLMWDVYDHSGFKPPKTSWRERWNRQE